MSEPCICGCGRVMLPGSFSLGPGIFSRGEHRARWGRSLLGGEPDPREAVYVGEGRWRATAPKDPRE